MHPLQLFDHWFWLLCLAPMLYLACRGESDYAPAGVDYLRRAVYQRRATLIATLPFFVMGAGEILGGVPAASSYLRPQDGNPWVLAWYATLLALTLLYIGWVFLAGGARTVSDYMLIGPIGRPGRPRITEREVKALAVRVPIWYAIVLAMLASGAAPPPH